MAGRIWAQRNAARPQPIRMTAPAADLGPGLDDATREIKSLYEQYPYPSPVAGESLIRDLTNAIEFLFPGRDLDGWNVFDAGCGSGHRLLALAKTYPKARFTGVDLSASSLGVAARMAQQHGVTNVTFRQANLLELDLPDRYDLVVTTGVVHHLSDPALGLRNIYRCLSAEGILYAWFYHSFGEFGRLLDRELARLLWGQSDLGDGIAVLEELGLTLPTEQYGNKTSVPGERDLSQTSIDADAYLHPIVNAYRFQEAVEMFRRAEAGWVAVNGINLEGKSKLLDLGRVSEHAFFCVSEQELFKTENLRLRYRGLSNTDKLRAVELALRPTGFSVLAGNGASHAQCGPRITHNLIEP